MDGFWPVFGAVLGACWGSFAHVVYGRTPTMMRQHATREKMTLWWSFPGSHCPVCKHSLSWYENVPVLGWMALRGKCRHCDAAIPARYLGWECVWAAAGAWVTWRYQWIGVGGFWAVLVLFAAVELSWRVKDRKKEVD